MSLTSLSSLPSLPSFKPLKLTPSHHTSTFISKPITSKLNTIHTKDESDGKEAKKWKGIVSTALAVAVISFICCDMSTLADLNKFEADVRGEFGIGSAAQFGSADLRL
ncbi:hypothetical protein Tco_0980858 [Tanacetum coccineum]